MVQAQQTILSNPIFVTTILPFLLVFTIVFAILQKSKILGSGKKQIDAIVSLVVGLLVISFGQATGIIIQLIPFLAVALVIILVFMIIVGSFHSDENFLGNKMKTFLTIISLIAVVIAVFYVTNAWQIIYEWLFFSGDSAIFANIIFFVIIIGAVAAVLWGSGSQKENNKP